MSEILKQQNEKNFGFPDKTIINDSQSSFALRGKEEEQWYLRMYLMGKLGDVVLIDRPINETYLNYLRNDLKQDLPLIINIGQAGGATLSENILAQQTVVRHIRSFLKINKNARMQFFSLNEGEKELIKQVGNRTNAEDIDGVFELGTKAGFRSFCEKHSIPMPPGSICHSIEEVQMAINWLKRDCLIKSSKGTGGSELGSNVKIKPGETHEVLVKMSNLKPNEPPYVVEAKLQNMKEGSLHVFLRRDGRKIYEPTIFGQITQDETYIGGYFPKDPDPIDAQVYRLAEEIIVPSLQAEKLTGMHCLDYLYDQNDLYFIEDNTRPGALDFIHHFATRVVGKFFPGEKFSWYHRVVPLEEIGIQEIHFEEVYEVLKELLSPVSPQAKKLEGFGLVSNPDVLPFGYGLHLTGIAYGKDKIAEDAELVFINVLGKLKEELKKKRS